MLCGLPLALPAPVYVLRTWQNVQMISQKQSTKAKLDVAVH